ncbi:MAG: tetratricopeptide repeat protein [Deltaproteobacteria bacterium]|nr:tetratricopeptide repeat protein [Deltaproteobacteria bacterium]MBW2071002.1 tetratricopeptide repeat protein [Deltaproteobacteria bacterium]
MKVKEAVIGLAVIGLFCYASLRLFQFTIADLEARAGKASLVAGDYHTAEQDFARSIDKAPSNAAYHRVYGDTLYEAAIDAGGTETTIELLLRARELYRKAAELNPYEAIHWFDLARTSWWLSKFKGHKQEGDKVESLFLQALVTDPKNPEFLYHVVNYYLVSGQPTRSLPYVKRLAQVSPGIYRDLRKLPLWTTTMEDQFRQGLQAAVSNPLVARQALAQLAAMAASEKDWLKAAAYTEELINKSGFNPSPGLYVNLGRYYLQLGDKSKAQQAFLRALEFSPDRYEALQHFAGYFKNSDDLGVYVQLCQETAKFEPAVAESLPLILGKAFYRNGHLEAAAHYLQQSLQHKETAEAHYYLAEIAAKRRDWNAVELESQKAAILKPANSSYHLLYVRSLEAQKKYAAALEAITRAIRYVSPTRDDLYNIQAQLFLKLGNRRAAIQAWQAARKIVPQNANYPRRIARTYTELQEYNSAVRYYHLALNLRPDDKNLRRELEEAKKRSEIVNGQR